MYAVITLNEQTGHAELHHMRAPTREGLICAFLTEFNTESESEFPLSEEGWQEFREWVTQSGDDLQYGILKVS